MIIALRTLTYSGIVDIMEGLNNINKSKKIALLVVSVLIIGATLYGTTAYVLNWWSFEQKATPNLAKPPAKSPKMTIVKPIVDTKTDILSTSTVIETKEQGDCKLTLTNGDDVYTLTNSTKDLEGMTGCLDWNIGTANMVAGEYDIEIKFIGKTQTASAAQKVTIP